MKRISFYLFVTMAMLMLSVSSAWAQYVKLTAPDGTVSWIEIEGSIDGIDIEINNVYETSAIDENTEGSIDLNEVWDFSGGRGTNYQVTSIGEYAFLNCSGLTSIDIPSSVTSIAPYAFSGCSGLTSVDIPSSVTSIGGSAFYECSGMTSIVILSNVTSIGDFAFAHCSGLTSVNIPSSVTSIGAYAFEYCSGLTSIVVELGNPVYDSRNNCNAIIETASNTLITGCKNTMIPSSVTSIGDYAFFFCSSLTSIEIPSSVTSIGVWAFRGCSGLTSIVVESGNSVYDSRNNCNAIIETVSNTLIVGCNNTKIPSSITNIAEAAFATYSNLTSIDIPSSVTSIGFFAFYGCSGLTSIVIPSSVTSIGNQAFYGCSGLTSITSYMTDVIKTGIDAFYGCSNATLYVPKGFANFYRSIADWNSIKKIEEIPGISLAMSCNNKGKVTVNGGVQFTNDMGEVSVYDGTDNTFVFTPEENCQLEQVLIDGLDVTLSVKNNQLTTKVHEGSKMIVTFSKSSGDMNGDGLVNISDVVKLVNVILGQ